MMSATMSAWGVLRIGGGDGGVDWLRLGYCVVLRMNAELQNFLVKA